MDQKLEAFYRREQRRMKDEVLFLREMIYTLSCGNPVQVFGDLPADKCDCDECEEAPADREWELVAPLAIDGFCRSLLSEVE